MLGVIAVEERALRRIIKTHYKLPGIGLQVPHTSCLAMARGDLARSMEPGDAEIDLATLPERVVVVQTELPAMALWRSIFHARVHQAFDELIASGSLTPAAIRSRLRRIGPTEVAEMRVVLRQEALLLPPVDDTRVYVELAATYLELRHFAPASIEKMFPAAVERGAELDAVIALDIDAEALLAASRPPNAPEIPRLASVAEADLVEVAMPEVVVPSARKPAQRARKRENRARAAILAARSGDHESARVDLDALVARLARAFGGANTTGWVDVLLLVARGAGTDRSLRFSAGAQLLHDLQAACVFAEREVKAVDVIGWALSRGKQPIVRPLPATRDVRVVRRVRAASSKVAACRLATREDRVRLADVMHEISACADEHLRTAYRPVITEALHAVGLLPRGIPERVAEKTLVDELLDRALAVGRLTLGDLRDALSRNDLKLPNLVFADLRHGDPLLRADSILSRSLDGVHRRGEMYMRWLQRISSVLFGTSIGRFLTRYALLPLLGSFAVVEGLQHMLEPFAKRLHYTVHISSRSTLIGGAAVLFVLLHVPPVRRGLWYALQFFWRGVRALLWDIPHGVWVHPLTRRIVTSWTMRWVVRPGMFAAVALAIAWHFDPWKWAVAGGTFVAFAVLPNTRFVRLAQEITIDWLVRSGRQFGKLIPGLVKLTIQVFAKLLELLERAIYHVEEWLRFRSGSSAIVILFKGLFGTIWFFITYVLRLYVNLFVEPTVNPIKHFPVVTVAAKIILPFIPAMISNIVSLTKPFVGPQIASTFAGFTVVVIPGLAGFLVWELKENWKLYRATRSRVLQPIVVGHHGETVTRLLRPGFHSGTIPKLFAKLRRAAARDDERAIAKAKENLHHVEEAVAKFVERQLASLLAAIPAFGATDATTKHVELASNRIDIDLACPSVAPVVATLRIELSGRWLVASIHQPGWIAKLDETRRRIFEIALAGFYKLAAIDVVREQLEHALRPSADAPPPPFDLADEGLVVWPGAGFETEVLYDLRSRRLRRIVRGALLEGESPPLAGRHALFGREAIYWSAWSTAWNQLERGDKPMTILTGPSVLP